ncbi:MAG TPA: hypothetical protein P5241_03320 [Candidatus Paceibacterota bacterium]|nr:hypothetical protein [Candidatus Paceibacterota bacterium]
MKARVNVKLNSIFNLTNIDDLIFDHFSNHDIEIVENSHPFYELTLERLPFLYCEDFTKGLDLFKIKEDEVLNFYNIDHKSIFTLLESWIPYGWSCFFAQRNEIPKNLTIIHLDDHSDLMSPFISVDESKLWKDILTGCSINIMEPESIKMAIESGAITLGSILTLLVFSVKNINIYHLKQNVKTTLKYIKKDIEVDPIIIPRQKKMSIKLLDDSYKYMAENSKYLITSDVNKLIESVKDNYDIFLHIDMDFFNNRYNGSTDFTNYHDPDINHQKNIIKIFCDAIAQSDLIDRIVHISIGLSPSFYPSEYWHDSLAALIYELKRNNFKIIPNIYIENRGNCE